MESITKIDDLMNQFETVCKVYTNENIGISLYDKYGNHIISRDNKKTCNLCSQNELWSKKKSNLFRVKNTNSQIKKIVDRDGVAYYDKQIATYDDTDSNEGGTLLISIKLVSITDQNKNVIGYLSINNDTTLYDKDNKTILAIARDKMADSLSLNDIISWSFDFDSPIMSFLKNGEIIKILRRDFESRIHPDDLVASNKFIEDMYLGKRAESSHIIRFKHIGSDVYRFHESRSKAIMDEKGNPKILLGTYRDITDEYLKQRKIEDSQKILETVLSESPILIWDYELTTKTTRVYNDNIFIKKSEYNQTEHNNLNNISSEDFKILSEACRRLASEKTEKEDFIIHIRTYKNEDKIAKCHLNFRKNDVNIITHIVGCFIDITSQVEHEKKEKEKNAIVDLVLRTDGSNAWYLSLDDGHFHLVLGKNFMGNDGKTIEEVWSMMTPKSQNECNVILNKLLSGEITNSSVIIEFVNPEDNTIKYIRNAFFVSYDNHGKISNIYGFQKDVTEDERKRESLLKYQRYSDIVNKVAQIIYWDYDLETKLIYTRGSMHNNGEPMTLDIFLTYIHPDEQHYMIDCMNAMDNHCAVIDPLEIRCLLPQYNRYRWVKFYITPIRSENKIIGYTGIRRDTNDERLNRQNLERLNSQINQVMSMSEIAPFIWRPEHDEFFFTTSSHLNQDIFNKQGTILSLKEVIASIHPEDRKIIIEISRKILSGQENRGWCKVRYDKKKRFKRTYIVSILPDETSKDERAFIGYLQDITNHEILTKRLVDEKLKAQESEKLKSNFLANMSHEIRTPLNAIVGFTGLLADVESKEEYNEFYQIIQKNSDMLLQLINDIIEISRIDAGRTERRPELFCLNELFEENYKMQKELIRIPDVNIELDIPDEELIVFLDRRRVTELLNNFMSNASKYTEKGYIRMGFVLANATRVRIYVEDTGCGIAEDNKEKIFGRFEKLNSFVQGAGLGMSICQHYVKEACGNIWVESKLGEGSKFNIELSIK